MKILSITTQKPHSTGSGTYLTEVVRSLRRLGHEQAVIAGVYPSDVVSFPENVDFYPVYYTEPGQQPTENQIPYPVLGMSDVMPYPSQLYSGLTSKMIDQMKMHFTQTIAEVIRTFQPDLILCHHLFLLTSIIRREFPDQKVYGLCHGSDLRQMRNLRAGNVGYDRSPIDPDELASSIADLDHIFALHSDQAEMIRELHLADAGKISVIGTGYNAGIFHPEEPKAAHPFRYIYAGKLCREKGIAELLQALSQLAAEVDEPFELWLAGGCHDTEIRKMLGSTEAEPPAVGPVSGYPFEIRYLGLLSQPELADAFCNSDSFVLASYYEGLPLVLIEAMACGLETVCNDLPGVQNWLKRSIPHYNTEFVDMPAMATVDQPEASAIPDYVARLKAALSASMAAAKDSANRPAPDTAGATWDAVAKRVLI